MTANTHVKHIDFDIAKDRMLSMSDLELMFDRSRQTINRWVKTGNFPKPVRIGSKTLRWVDRHVTDWINQKVKEAQLYRQTPIPEKE